MKKTIEEKLRNNKAVTLVVLVLTIVVLLILAGVSVNVIFGNNGLINKAKESKEEYKKGMLNDEKSINELDEYIEKQDKNFISKDINFVGYYADLDGNGKIDIDKDGIIYVDIANEKKNSLGQYGNMDGKYDYKVNKNVKDYVISKEKYKGKFGNKEWITLEKNSNGSDRFYVMALQDFRPKKLNGNSIWYEFTWYANAIGSLETNWTDQSDIIGKGIENSKNMILPKTGFNFAEGDIWKEAKEKIEKENWFVPSKAEWAAFGGELEIKTTEYMNKNELSTFYWTSTIFDGGCPWNIDFSEGLFQYIESDLSGTVRLSKTF